MQFFWANWKVRPPTLQPAIYRPHRPYRPQLLIHKGNKARDMDDADAMDARILNQTAFPPDLARIWRSDEERKPLS